MEQDGVEVLHSGRQNVFGYPLTFVLVEFWSDQVVVVGETAVFLSVDELDLAGGIGFTAWVLIIQISLPILLNNFFMIQSRQPIVIKDVWHPMRQ